MEIIILLVILGGSFPFLVAVLGDGQITGRMGRAIKSTMNRNKQLTRRRATPDLMAVTSRNKDWGPNGKLTKMWDDAFEYLEDPR